MGRSCFNKILLISLLMLLTFSQGYSRKLIIHTVEDKDHSIAHLKVRVGRGMIEVMDYSEPGPNTNPRAGYLLSPPPPQT